MPSFDNRLEYFKRLILVLDLALLAGSFVIVTRAYAAARGGDYFDDIAHLGLLPIILLVFAIARRSFGWDIDIQSQTFRAQAICVVKELALAIGFIVILIFLLKLDHVSRAILLGFSIMGAFLIIAVRRFLIWYYVSRPAFSEESRLRVLIVGSGRRAHMLADQMQKSSAWGVHIVGFLDPRGESAGRRVEDEILGHVDDISVILRDNVVEDVIVAVPRGLIGDVQKIIDACQEEGVRLRFMADFYDFEAARVRLNMVSGIPLLSFEPVARGDGALFAKRIFDLVVTIAMLPILVPIFAITALAVRIDSRGPIFFVQERVGLNKRKFRMFKFRSMVADAEARMEEIEHLNEADGPNFKILEDPRVTKLGRFLRKTSIDELPQLINVLIGDMSLVGPRPMSIRDVALFDRGQQRKRFSVRPGITCLWQISGRSDLSFEEWLQLDLKYIESWTFWEDIRILLKTIPVVLKGSGAA